MKIYVIIVTYNAKKWINNCIDSILNSSIQANIVVVDNCSIDDTCSILKNNYPECVVLNQKKNLGFGVANNVGIKYALSKGADYVALLNQDAKLHENTLEKLFHYAESYPNYGILSPMFHSYDGNELDLFLLKWVYYYDLSLASDIFFRRENEVYDNLQLIPAAMWFIRKKAIEEVGVFDPLYFMYKEDDDLWTRMKKKGWNVGFFPKALVYHYTSKDNSFTIKKRKWHTYGSMLLHMKRENHSFVNNISSLIIDYFRRSLMSMIFFNKSELFVLQYSFFSVMLRLKTIYKHRKICMGEGSFLK